MAHPHLKNPSSLKRPSTAGLGTRRYLELFEQLTPLIGNQDQNDICERACGLIAQLLEVEACSLFLLDPSRRTLRLASATHLPREQWGHIVLGLEEGICGKVFCDGRPLLIEGEGSFVRQFGRKPNERYHTASCVIAPFAVQGRAEGVINVARPVGRRVFRQRDVDLLEAAANLIGCALATAIQACETRLLHRNLEDLFDSLHVGVLAVNDEGRVIRSNQRARTLLGLHIRNGERPELASVLPGTVYNVCQRLIRATGCGRESTQDRIKACVGGRECLLEITAGSMPGFGSQHTDGIIIFEDVAQDEEVKRLRESESMKHGFLSIISHELRTPLAVIRSAVPLIDPSQGRPIETDTLRQIHHLLLKNCQRLGDVISTILDVTEIESGTLQLNLRQMDLHEVLDEVISMQAENAAHRQLAWDCRFEARRHELKADQRRLRQIFCEMIANAIKFSNPGGTISILTRVAEPWLEVEISNAGARIVPEQRRIIFEKFIQGNQTMTRTAGGCGLGLFLVQNLLRLHGGEVVLREGDSDVTTFVVRLPLESPADAPAGGGAAAGKD